MTGYPEGAAKAIQAFRKEQTENNPGFVYAVQALENDFSDANADGPLRAAQFLRADEGQGQRLKEELVTAAKFMLGQ